MKFVIPSYKRHDILMNKTYNYLIKHNINTDDIYIMVRSDDPQLEEYKRIKANIVVTDIRHITSYRRISERENI
jgi:hypothetical protein